MANRQVGDVTLGLVLPPYDEPSRLWDAARAAEEHGFHSVWVTDATLPGYPWLDAFSVLGGVVAVTNTVQVGTSIFVLARRNPVLVAHTLTTLDYLSGGRLIFGVGVNEKFLRPQEYATAGVPMEQRGAITDEYLTLIRRLWTESSVIHQGKFFQCSDITVEPKPVRRGKIPIWIGGRAEGSLRRAAANGDGWMPSTVTATGLITPSDYRALWSKLREYITAEGRDMASITGAVYLFASIGASYEEARGVLAPGMEAIFRAPFENFEPVCLVGTPDQWVEQIGRYADVGVTHVNVLLYTRDLIGDVQRIGQEVVPRL